MFKYRDHRGSLAESIETVQEFNDLQALLDYLRKTFKEFGFEFTDKALKIKPYCYDKRINWDTHIVTIDNFGVVGFTNANPKLEKMEEQNYAKLEKYLSAMWEKNK